MQLSHNVKGMSKIILIFLLLVSFALGALLSYVWTMGFYAPLEFKLPTRPTIVIQDVKFDAQNASYFNITVLNPSYSTASAVITKIEARTTQDGFLHSIDFSEPSIPYALGRGKIQTFTCFFDWANYTGIILPPSPDKPVEIKVLLADDSFGEIAVVLKPFVSLSMTDLVFNSSVTSSFKVNVQNLQTSVTYVNVTSINVNVAENISATTIAPRLPYGLAPGAPAVTFTVPWDWSTFRNQTVTITVHTRQGYIGQATTEIP